MAIIKETLADLFGLDKMDPAKGAEILERLGKLVFQATLVRVLPMLSEADTAEYENIVNGKGDGEMLFKFLNEKIPDFEKIMMEEAQILRAELAGEFNEAGI